MPCRCRGRTLLRQDNERDQDDIAERLLDALRESAHHKVPGAGFVREGTRQGVGRLPYRQRGSCKISDIPTICGIATTAGRVVRSKRLLARVGT